MLNNVSIIIPLAPDEKAHLRLAEFLKQETEAEIILSSEGSRAKSLNTGTQKATRDFLWFLHADSYVMQENLTALEKSLSTTPDGLHYFNLKFDKGGLIKLNQWGGNMRSKIFNLPFGDQGFCVSKETFEKIGNYPEDLTIAEDLKFILNAKRAGIKLKNIPSPLATSARKYKITGWLSLTLTYQKIWMGMVLKDLIK